MDHPVANLLRNPTVFDPFNHALAQQGVSYELSVSRTSIRRHQLGTAP
jgi:hypothetical protein